MKKLICILFPLFLAFSSWTQKQYTLNAKIATLQEGTVKLQVMEQDGNLKEEIIPVKNKSFAAKGSVKQPCVATIWINNTRERYSFYIENSNINIQLQNTEAGKKFSVTGSKTNDAYENFVKICKETPESEQDNCAKKLVSENGSSVFSPFVIQSTLVYTADYSELKNLLEGLSGEAVSTYQYKKLQERLEALFKVSAGQPAPYFEQPDANGESISLKEALQGKKFLLIDFWASWCRPCRQENPNIVKAYEAFHEKGFDIIAISLDDNKEKWLEAIKADGLTWTHVSNLKGWENEVAKLYCVNSIPSNVLVDQNGIILVRNLHGENLMKNLEELLGPIH